MTARRISRDTARLFLARRHLLAPPRSLPVGREGVLAVFERLGSVQFDPLEVAGRNHDLVLAARVADYRREMTDALLYDERRLFEAYNKGLSLLPTHELPWFRQTWDRRREGYESGTFQTHRELVDEILERIRREGPLSSIDFETRDVIDWHWRPTNQVRAILEALAESGILGFARRQGNRRYYDLAERLFPAAILDQRPDPLEQRRHRLLSRFRGHGLLGRSGSAELWLGAAPGKVSATYHGPVRLELVDQLVESGELVAVAVDGIRGERYVIAGELGILDQAERDASAVTTAAATPPGAGEPGHHWRPLDPERAGVAMLAPLDPLVWDREFLRSLYGFDYLWEVYIPEPKRRWGYYVLPLLWGDRFVGRIEPRIDRKADAVRILNVYWEEGFAPRDHPVFLDGLGEALEAHRRFAGVGRVLLSRAASGVALRRDFDGRLASVGRPARRSVGPAGASGRRRSVVGR